MTRKILAALALLLAFAPLVQAQSYRVSGQIVMPDGSLPARSLQIHLSSNDGRIDEFHYTDSTGGFNIPTRQFLVLHFTITVPGDGVTFATTQYSFGRDSGPVRITLNPPKPEATGKVPTVSAASVYRPKPEAEKLHKKALKELEQEQHAAAEASLRRAVAVDSQFAEAFNDLGALLGKQRRYAESEETFRKGLQADPKSPRILANLGQALNHLGRHSEAVPFLRESLRLEPGVGATDLQLGIALQELGQLAEAETVLQRASETEGSTGHAALLRLSLLYAHTRQWEKGIAALELYLQKAPEGASAEAARELLERMKRRIAARP
jgi:Tfp pilus assembly protein PilF